MAKEDGLEATSHFEEVDDDDETGTEALDYDFQEGPDTSIDLVKDKNGRVLQAEEVDVIAVRIEEANTILPKTYGACVRDGEAAQVVLKFKEAFQQAEKRNRKEKVWETFISCLGNTLELDYFYYALEFFKTTSKLIGTKAKNVIRQKYADIQTILVTALRETYKPAKTREPRRSTSAENSLLATNSIESAMYLGLKEYIDCRMRMIDLYLTTFPNYEKFVEWNDFLIRVIEYQKPLLKDFPSILTPAVDYFKEELDILKQLITTHQGIAQMHTITQNLIELTKIRSEIVTWAKDFEMPENSPLPIIGRLQKQELLPKYHTALWFLKFYDFLTAKISLYITDHMSPFISVEDLKAMHDQDNEYNYIEQFKHFCNYNRPSLVAIVMDRSSLEEPFFGFNNPNQHISFSNIPPHPFEAEAASHPYVFKVELSMVEAPRNASGGIAEKVHPDVADIVNLGREHFAQNPICALNPKPRPVLEWLSPRDTERTLYCDHIEENLYVVAVFQGGTLNASVDFTNFCRTLLPSLTGQSLFTEMRKLLSS